MPPRPEKILPVANITSANLGLTLENDGLSTKVVLEGTAALRGEKGSKGIKGILLFRCKSLAKCYGFAMKVIVHLTKEEEAKALPILLRHSPGMVLPHRRYVLSEDALRALRKADIRFSELSREAAAPSLEEVVGERV